MTRIRKGSNRYWSKEEKLKIINEVLANHHMKLLKNMMHQVE